MAMLSARRYLWGRSLAAGAIIATVQAVAFVVSMLVWRATAGTWGSAAYVAYFLAFAIVVPAVGWLVAAHVVGGRFAPWHAWPVGLVGLLIVLSGHGFEEAGLPPWVPVVAMGVLSFVFGTLWFAERGWTRGS